MAPRPQSPCLVGEAVVTVGGLKEPTRLFFFSLNSLAARAEVTYLAVRLKASGNTEEQPQGASAGREAYLFFSAEAVSPHNNGSLQTIQCLVKRLELFSSSS